MLYLSPILFASFFLSLNFGILLYIKSSLVGELLNEPFSSIIFFFSAILNIIFFLLTPRILKKFGVENAFLFFVLLVALGTWGLFASKLSWQIAFSLILYECFMFMSYWCLDIFLEERTSNAKTGEIRGVYFTLLNLGIAIGPLLLTLLVKGNELVNIYLSATLFLCFPIAFAILKVLNERKISFDNKPEEINLPFNDWFKNKNIRSITNIRIVLETFFASMVIYIPIYLYETIGFGWSELGLIFTIMLLPFVILEWPAGWLADNVMGEKEILSTGLFITGVSLLIMPFLGKNYFAWMGILFLSRIGASLIEIMTESYFFKKTSINDYGLISIFRLARPFGVMFGTSIGLFASYFLSIQIIFVLLSLFVLVGLYEALSINDTL